MTLIETRGTGRSVDVVGRWEMDTPRGTVSGPVVHDPPRLGVALRTLRRRAGVRGRVVNLVLPPSGYSARALRLPDIPEGERRPIVRGELEQTGALPFGGGGFDFLWLQTRPGEAADVHAYFAGDGLIEPLREALDEAGLKLGVLQPSSLATIRAYLSTAPAARSLAVLYPAERYSDLCIHDGSEVRLLRRIPAGWADIDRGLQESRQPTRLVPDGDEEPPWRAPQEPAVPTAVWSEDAEGVVSFQPQPFAAPLEGAPARATAAQPVPAPAETSVAPRERSLLEEEVARSFAFYAREHQGRPLPEMLVIVGRGPTASRFEQIFSGSVPVSVVAVDITHEVHLPLPTFMGTETQPDELLLAALYGAAVGGAGNACGIPVLDVAQQDRAPSLGARGRRRLVYTGLGGAGVLLALAAVAAGVMTLVEMQAEAENTEIQNEIRAIQAQREPILRYNTVSNAARGLRERTQIPVGSVLGRVAAAANGGIALHTLQLSPEGKLTLEGNASSTRSLEQFGRELSQGATVRLPVIESMHRGKEADISFRITALVRGGAGPKAEGGK